MITNLVNNALKAPFGAASITSTFSTDGTAPLVLSGTCTTANYDKITVPSSTGVVTGDFFSIEGANYSGTGPWVQVVNGFSSTIINVPVPAVRTLVTNAVMTRYERIETRYKPKKVVLTNTSNGDTYTWDQSLNMLDNTANFLPGAGGTSTLVSNAMLIRSNVIGIHPNVLPLNSNFTLKCDYDYYS